jgi:hypothetical protein
MTQAFSFLKAGTAKVASERTWKVAPQKTAAKRPLLRRILGRSEPTTYQRCLAVHLHYASPRSGLS